MKNWQIKKGAERKFRFGHPWVFSNDLAQSPKGIELGELIELQDFEGRFLARGYGHPHSLIAFRTLSLDSSDTIDASFFSKRLAAALRLREIAGLKSQSYRLCYAEGDWLPGLVIDRYFIKSGGAEISRDLDFGAENLKKAARDQTNDLQVFVVQASTAGMDKLVPLVLSGLEQLVALESQNQNGGPRPSWDKTSIIVANDTKSRVMEGLQVEPKVIVRQAPGFDPKNTCLAIQSADPRDESAVLFNTDLIGGQKTGFFLDQRSNIQIASRFAQGLAELKKEIRILDLCCYVGQWGTQLSNTIVKSGAKARVTLVDASASALDYAVKNVERVGGIAEPVKVDVLEAFDKFGPRMYDIVICDPPAFIKKKKDLPTGTQAYFKMNREALRKTAYQGLYISCSCSGLFTEEDFRSMLARATNASGVNVTWLARGSHSPDHPQRPEFPQGTYLKSWMGVAT